jgi:hypothetical protein
MTSKFATHMIDQSTTPDTALTVQQIIAAARSAGMTGADIVTAIDTELGSTDWQDGGGTGPAGADGDSAYEIAVANGFVGNQAAWLASLVGDDGIGILDANIDDDNHLILIRDDLSEIDAGELPSGVGSYGTQCCGSVEVLPMAFSSGQSLTHYPTAIDSGDKLVAVLRAGATSTPAEIVAVSRTSAYPAGAIAGDTFFLILVQDVGTTTIPALPSGWTAVSTGQATVAGNTAYRICSRVAAGGETGTISGITTGARSVTLVRNAGTLTATAAYKTVGGGNSPPATLTGLTSGTTYAGIVMVFDSDYDASTTVAVSGYTDHGTTSGTRLFTRHSVTGVTQIAPSGVMRDNDGDVMCCITIAIGPSGGGAVTVPALPSGWASVATATAGTLAVRVISRDCAGTEDGSALGFTHAGIMRLRNAGAVTVAAATAAGDTATFAADAIASDDGSLLWYWRTVSAANTTNLLSQPLFTPGISSQALTFSEHLQLRLAKGLFRSTSIGTSTSAAADHVCLTILAARAS